MNIAVIFTGGTIGSTEENGSIAPAECSAVRLLNCVTGIETEGEWSRILDDKIAQPDENYEEIIWQDSSPLTILSENSTGILINKIKESVEQVLLQPGVDGVIVTHGTDTLAYTAAALGYLFADSTVPIVIVSSNYVLDNLLANGWDNFRYGAAFLAYLFRQERRFSGDSSRPKGVFVSYRNGDGVPRIHRGTALLAHQAYSDEVYSVLNKEYGSFEIDGERCRFVRGEGRDTVQTVDNAVLYPRLLAPVTWKAPILQIYPYPGMEYPVIPENTKAILHHSYHSGTICTHRSSNAEAFFEEAKQRGIPVFLSSAYGTDKIHGADGGYAPEKENRAQYESTKDFGRLGIIPLPAAAPVAMYMKLWLLLDSGEDVILWMQHSIPGDICIL